MNSKSKLEEMISDTRSESNWNMPGINYIPCFDFPQRTAQLPNDYFAGPDSNKGVLHGFDAKPAQYQIGIDTFSRAEANMNFEELMACCRFNIDKYTWRKKGQDLEDFKKIIAYAEFAIKQLKK